MKEDKRRDNRSVQNVHSKYVLSDAFDLAEHRFRRFLTSVSSEAPGLTYLLPGLLSLILYLLAFAILQTRS